MIILVSVASCPLPGSGSAFGIPGSVYCLLLDGYSVIGKNTFFRKETLTHRKPKNRKRLTGTEH